VRFVEVLRNAKPQRELNMSAKYSGARSFAFFSTLLMTTALTVPAFAQIETVVVTAEKRAADVQTVPVAISVFTPKSATPSASRRSRT
jgi:outer membrane receptor protein involved in Fe transport